ncbi:unnamed protein product [Parnassius apollo]|uniref:(apollo) hypothetical protein n=1 Tax=Parnassius apollo TaxID=110799 RepID=A0A8S3Y5M0_PARAO|nr:unnamed protein product [Parnassius apollo]
MSIHDQVTPLLSMGFQAALRTRGKRSNKTKATPATLSVNFRNISGLHSNLNAVHYHLETARPALLFLAETQVSSPPDVSYLSYPGYKLEHFFVPRAGVCVYVREDISSRRLGSLEGSDLSFLWIRVDSDDHPRVYGASIGPIAIMPKQTDTSTSSQWLQIRCYSKSPPQRL